MEAEAAPRVHPTKIRTCTESAQFEFCPCSYCGACGTQEVAKMWGTPLGVPKVQTFSNWAMKALVGQQLLSTFFTVRRSLAHSGHFAKGLKQNHSFATAIMLVFSLSTSKYNGKRLKQQETTAAQTQKKRRPGFGWLHTTKPKTKTWAICNISAAQKRSVGHSLVTDISLEQCLSTGCIVHPRVYQNFLGVYHCDGVYQVCALEEQSDCLTFNLLSSSSVY